MAIPALSVSEALFRWPGQATLLKIDELHVAAGERLFLRGSSGSGKSTLLALIAGIHRPQAARFEVLGSDLCRMSASARDRFRGCNLGIVFQQFNLVPCLNALENVLLPLTFNKPLRNSLESPAHARERAEELLARLAIGPELHGHQPRALSVGQQQRVAVARALLGSPRLILCDEPTSALDADHRETFMRLLLAEAERLGSAVVFVSHDASLATRFHRVVDISTFRDDPEPTL